MSRALLAVVLFVACSKSDAGHAPASSKGTKLSWRSVKPASGTPLVPRARCLASNAIALQVDGAKLERLSYMRLSGDGQYSFLVADREAGPVTFVRFPVTRGDAEAFAMLDDVAAISPSHDGKQAFLAAAQSPTLWREGTLQATTLTDPSFVGGIDPTGRYLAWEETNAIAVFDRKVGTVRRLALESFVTRAIAFAPDGKTLAVAGGKNQDTGRVLVWATGTGRKLADLEPSGGIVTAVAFSPDGKRLATGTFHVTFHLLDTASYKSIAEHTAGETEHADVVFSQDGELAIVSSHGAVHAFGAKDGKARWTITQDIPRDGYADAGSLAVTSDGALRIVGSGQNVDGDLGAVITQYDASTGKPRTFERCAK